MLRTTRFMTLRLESEGEGSLSELLMVVVPEDGYEVKQSLHSTLSGESFWKLAQNGLRCGLRSHRKLVSLASK